MSMSEFFSNLGIWDVVLAIAVTITGTFAAYIPHPKWKAFLLLTPIPFSFAALALGQPVNVTHMTALLVLLLYTFGVRMFYRRFKFPIIAAIAVSAAGYCIAGGILTAIIPKNQTSFLIATVVVSIVAAILHSSMPCPIEPKQKSPLPVWKKFIAILSVVCFIITIKSTLQGFMVIFPMVGVIVAYESRLSLYTVSRHIPVAMLSFVPLLTTCFVLQEHIGFVPALLISLVVYFIVLPLFILPLWKKYDAEENLIKKE